METSSPSGIPDQPRLRPIEAQWTEHQGDRYIYLRDPMALAEHAVLVPQAVVPLLALCDGTRNVPALQAGLLLRTGLQLPTSTIRELLAQLDQALLLENGTYQTAKERVLQEYRALEHRLPSHAGLVYPAEPEELSALIGEYCRMTPVEPNPEPVAGKLVGMVSPHIDYARGHETYAQLWQRAAPGLEGVELTIIFGTDHSGGPGMLTLTRQNYATPMGVLQTERSVVDKVADALGADRAFAEEIHHVKEHSIELATVWLHYFMDGRSCPMVPILCGSFHPFVAGEGDPADDEAIDAALAALRKETEGRRTLVVAAADLAHVGPAFGDSAPLDELARAKLAAEDDDSLAAIREGDAGAFFDKSRQEYDARRLCGLPPIYMALRYLDGALGESMGYAQCAADVAGGSVVSIAGVLLYERS